MNPRSILAALSAASALSIGPEPVPTASSSNYEPPSDANFTPPRQHRKAKARRQIARASRQRNRRK